MWQPYPDSPQQRAVDSPADVLGYGGEAGGGKTDLLIGLPGTHHWRSIIFRREFPRVRAIIERSREIFNARGDAASKDSYNEQTHLWRLSNGRQIEFAAMQLEADKLNYQGRPHDFYGFDEATEFSESQIRFVIGWNRSTHVDNGRPQRCRVVLTFNPPMSESGEWIVAFFLPWLAYLYPDQYQHPRPAAPGDLRWYATIDGKDEEVDESELLWCAQLHGRTWEVESDIVFRQDGYWIVPVRGVERDGKIALAKSRTFIPASLKDNPVLEATGYGATIDAMPEPYRSLLKGQWGAGKSADPWAVLPSAWVKEAQARWTPEAPNDIELDALGVDVARGGKDNTVVARRYGWWYAPLDAFPGRDTPDGQSTAALVLGVHEGDAIVAIDVVGVGSSPHDFLVDMVPTVAINAGAGAKDDQGNEYTSQSGKLHFGNMRAYLWWRFREALDPKTGDDLALPPDPELKTELCAPKFFIRSGRIWVESKEDVIERIGRSTDRADAVIMAKTERARLFLWDRDSDAFDDDE